MFVLVPTSMGDVRTSTNKFKRCSYKYAQVQPHTYFPGVLRKMQNNSKTARAISPQPHGRFQWDFDQRRIFPISTELTQQVSPDGKWRPRSSELRLYAILLGQISRTAELRREVRTNQPYSTQYNVWQYVPGPASGGHVQIYEFRGEQGNYPERRRCAQPKRWLTIGRGTSFSQ